MEEWGNGDRKNRRISRGRFNINARIIMERKNWVVSQWKGYPERIIIKTVRQHDSISTLLRNGSHERYSRSIAGNLIIKKLYIIILQ